MRKIGTCMNCRGDGSIVANGLCRNCYQRDYNREAMETAFPGRGMQKHRQARAKQLGLLSKVVALVEELGVEVEVDGELKGCLSEEHAAAIKSAVQPYILERAVELNPTVKFTLADDDDDVNPPQEPGPVLFTKPGPGGNVNSGEVPMAEGDDEFTEKPADENVNSETVPASEDDFFDDEDLLQG